ncbi:hypothetical protein [Ascidiimonas aurantiaca]|uniref:hypothetical protein n=1 Tax=Ascidiimonas aurantiaca TaxID=1685432 RepID=UPI0030EE0AD5
MKISRTPGYYDAYIKRNERFIKQDEEKVQNFVPNPLNDVMPGRLSNESILAKTKLTTFFLRLYNLIAAFSRGDDLNEIRKQLNFKSY